MIDAIITFSIRNRALVIGASLVLAALGAWAAWETPVDAIPDLSENQVIVFTEWKGHGPREIEDQVTFPLTLGLRGLRGVRVVRSSSDVGFSMISVIFDDRGESRAKDAGAWPSGWRELSAQLPSGASPELTPDAAATGQIFWYTVEGAGFDLGRLRAIQDWYVRPQLGSVAGVADVSSVGGFPIEYQVIPDPNRLRVFGVSLSDVVEAVSTSNASSGGHVIHKGNAEYVVRGVGRLGASPKPGDESFDPDRAIRDLENVVVPLAKGGTIRLAEVADVALGPGFRRGALEKDGNEVTGGVVLMAHGENPLEVTRRIKAKISELQTGLPRESRIVPFYDRTPLIQGAISTVTTYCCRGHDRGIVVRASGLASRANVACHRVHAPLAALTSFLIMAFLRRIGLVDIQANAMSLAGIAISIGVLVDSSVVMAENVMHRLREEFGSQTVRGDVREVVLRGLPGRGPADRLLGGDHGAVVPAGLRLRRARGEDVPPVGLHQDIRPRRGRGSGDHAGARTLHRFHSRSPSIRDGEPADTKRDRGLPAGAVVPDGSAGGTGVDSGCHVSFWAGTARHSVRFSGDIVCGDGRHSPSIATVANCRGCRGEPLDRGLGRRSDDAAACP